MDLMNDALDAANRLAALLSGSAADAAREEATSIAVDVAADATN